MNGVHDFKNNGGATQADDYPSPRVFFRNRSFDNYYTSNLSPLSGSSSSTTFSRSPSLSRTSSLSSRTPIPASASASRLLRSMSRKNIDAAAAAASAASPARGGAPLSRSSSRKVSSTTNGFPVALPAGSLPRRLNRTGSMPTMYSSLFGLIKPPAIEKNLECTLEELCLGCIKRMLIIRDVVTNNGKIVKEEEMLIIKVKPGWRKGMKVTFEGMGNETPGTHPADIIFVIVEKRHPLFTTKGDDLELSIEITLLNALIGCTLSIPLLGGENMSLTIDDIIQPGYEKIIVGQGMPKSKEQRNRGNLIIKFVVKFPTELTDEQRTNVFSLLQDSC
ncbi:unnamed protein product [Camellia sinensis]